MPGGTSARTHDDVIRVRRISRADVVVGNLREDIDRVRTGRRTVGDCDPGKGAGSGLANRVAGDGQVHRVAAACVVVPDAGVAVVLLDDVVRDVERQRSGAAR